jgi:hypothetical protein
VAISEKSSLVTLTMTGEVVKCCQSEGGVMKGLVRRLARNESGQAVLAMVLVLLVVGALIMGPLLGFMGTGLKAGQMHETKTLEYYAADSGVEDAIFWLPELQQNGGSAGPYTNWTRATPYCINDADVGVTIQDEAGGFYKITSTASSDDGGNTTIESYVSPVIMDFSGLLENAITSNATITIQPGTTVTGDVQLPDLQGLDNKGNITGTIKTYPINWPTGEQLSDFYLEDVKNLSPFPYSSITVSGTPSNPTPIEPLYRVGSLELKGWGNGQLGGTVYLTGDLTVNPTPTLTIDLNGQTIFAEGTIDFGPKCTISGEGCIIAVGDVFFNPHLSSQECSFVFVMSIDGEVKLNPDGDFCGSVAGDVHVQIQPGNTLKWVEPSDDLNFPEGTGNKGWTGLSILTWQINS